MSSHSAQNRTRECNVYAHGHDNACQQLKCSVNECNYRQQRGMVHYWLRSGLIAFA
jgi:hypothetical protein